MWAGLVAAAYPAWAEDETPQTEPSHDARQSDAVSSPDANPPTEQPLDEDAILLGMAMEGEVIEVWAERPDKPFDRDTTVRLTDVELSERGVTNLAEALELVPELNVRYAGRGGRTLDVRGGRKGSIKVLIDGVPVADPFYGTFDISSIPVTDIVQIRVSATPASPIDGVGGPGGVVEVHTRDAIGGRRLDTRVLGSSLPEAHAAATARTMLGEHWAVRPSATATVGSHEFGFMTNRIDESRREFNGAVRLEYRKGKRSLVGDVAVQDRSFVVPPKDTMRGDIRFIDGENTVRVGLTGDDQIGSWRLQGQLFGQILSRESLVYTRSNARSRYGPATAYENYSMDNVSRLEDLMATRFGSRFLANRSLRKRFHLIGSAVFITESADVANVSLLNNASGDESKTEGRSSMGEVAAGLQWEDGPFRIDSAVGLAVPIGVDANPWPEFKVTAWARAMPGINFKLTGGYKGRLPTLRERYQSGTGNESLDPEEALFGEISTIIKVRRWFFFESSAYVRDTEGMIKLGLDRDGVYRLLNLGQLTIRGIDSQVKIAPERALSGGASWSYISPAPLRGGDEPLDFLPRHRAAIWLSAHRDQRAGGTIRLRYTGNQWDQGQKLPTREIFDLSAFAKIGAGLFANLRVDNLTDDRFQLRAGVESPGRVIITSLYGQWE
ncbi:MAG: TonB-dependent receptor [Proteobacteria bacterium]|nr:TonB-dependent receptor [Pseudomonadota bacterium]